MDLVGRKGFTILGMTLMTLMLFITPLASSVYPSLLLCNIGLKVGSVVGLNTPLTVDYVAKESMGATAAAFSILAVIPQIISSSGFIWAST